MLSNMTRPDDLFIERTTDLDLSADELWSLISTAEGWSSWLVDEARVDVQPDAEGSATDDGVVREVRIDTVDHGRSINFSWWDRDDPSTASYVQLQIVELPDRRSQLHIAEQFVGATTTARVSAEAGMSWDVRMISLWLLALHCTVMA
jgi:uncharacterized protein YndB with AHSA1/START domain